MIKFNVNKTLAWGAVINFQISLIKFWISVKSFLTITTNANAITIQITIAVSLGLILTSPLVDLKSILLCIL